MSVSGLVHLLAVELRCVFISALSLCTFIRTIERELLHKTEEDKTEPQLIAFFCAPAVALLLAASMSLLCSSGCQSFRSGEYIAFTCQLVSKWWYRVLVLVMVASVVTTFATAYQEVSASIPSESMQVQCCSFVAQIDHEKLGMQPDFSFCCDQIEHLELDSLRVDCFEPSFEAPPPPPPPMLPPPHEWKARTTTPNPFRMPPLLDPWHMWKPDLVEDDFPPLPDQWNAEWVLISYKWRTGCKRVLRHPWLKPLWPRALLLVGRIGVSFILLLGTTAALIAPRKPSFDVAEPGFRSITFQRPWYSVLTTSNEAFLRSLQEALFLSDVEQHMLLKNLLKEDDIGKARSIKRAHPKTIVKELEEGMEGNVCRGQDTDSESYDSDD